MHVVIVSDTGYVDGGAPKVAIASAQGLAAVGLSVSYVCASAPIAPELNHPNIKVHCLNIESVWKRSNPIAAAAQGIWNSSAKASLAKILTALPANDTIVHFHQWTKSLSPSILAVPSTLALPSIVSLHDYFLSCPTGLYYHFPSGVPCNLVPMSGACIAARCDSRNSLHKAVRVARQFATDKALRQVGNTLSVLNVTPFAKTVIDKFIPDQHRRYTVLYPIEAAQEETVVVARNREFVFVGRLTPEKGVRQLADAARQTGLPVTFVGTGPLLEEMRAHGGAIHCTGWVDADTVGSIMKRARALVFPSNWYETCGIVVLEALARGIPVIASSKTGAADFILDGTNGYLIDPTDIAALKTRMMDLTDDATAQAMGQEAYARYWADPMTADVHVSRLLEVYQSVLTEHEQRKMDQPQ
jgi:glycosyltransferase involved in cell wall biosynthesis